MFILQVLGSTPRSVACVAGLLLSLVPGCAARPPVSDCGFEAYQMERLGNAWDSCDRGDAVGCLLGGSLAEHHVGGGAFEALGFYRKACERGLAEGCYHQGRLQLRGDASLLDPAAANAALASACQHGFASACEAIEEPGTVMWLGPPDEYEIVRRAEAVDAGPPEAVEQPTPPPTVEPLQPVQPIEPAVTVEPETPAELPPCAVVTRFAPRSTSPTPEDALTLREVRKVLDAHPEILLLDVEGHASTTEARPKELAQRRADQIVRLLVSLGVERSRLRPRGFSDLCPGPPRVELCVARATSAAVHRLGCPAAEAAGYPVER